MLPVFGLSLLCATFSTFASGELVDLILKNEENVAEEVRRLINDKGDEIVDEVNAEGRSAISAALKIKNLEVLQILVNHGVNLNVLMEWELQYPLHTAIQIGWPEAVKLFLEKNVDLELRNRYLDTVLHDSVMYGNGEIFSELLDKKERIGPIVNAKNEDLDTALHLAATLEEPNGSKFVTALLVAGSEINSTNKVGGTPLHEAVRNNRLETVKALLSQQADWSMVDKFNHRASEFTYPYRDAHKKQIHDEIISILKKTEAAVIADVILENKENVAKEVQRLIKVKGGGIVDEVNEEGKSAISAALEMKNLEVIQILVNYGVNLNVEMMGKGYYPLHESVCFGLPDIVQLFLHNGADITLKGSDGSTCLHYVMMFPNKEVLKVLLAKQPEVGNILNLPCEIAKRRTPLHLAATLPDPYSCDFATFLLNAGAIVDCLDLENKTPLHVAVMNSKLETVKVLLDFQASLGVKDFKGKTPADYAKFMSESALDLNKKKEYKKMYRVLRNAGKAHCDIFGSHLVAGKIVDTIAHF